MISKVFTKNYISEKSSEGQQKLEKLFNAQKH